MALPRCRDLRADGRSGLRRDFRRHVNVMGNLIRGNYRRLADIALRIVLGAVFMYAGAMKIGDLVHLADSIAAFEILPRITSPGLCSAAVALRLASAPSIP